MLILMLMLWIVVFEGQVGIPVGGHSTFSVGWTGVPEAIKHSRKPPPSLSCKQATGNQSLFSW